MLIVQGTLESPLIVCGLSDTLRESPNVEETRNQMQSSGWKKYTHFSPTNVSYAFHPESASCASCNITYLVKQDDLLNAAAFFQERDYVF